MKKTLAYILTFLSCSMLTFGQQMPDVTMFKKNVEYLNPGATGNKEALGASFLFKKQWISIPGSPLFQAFTVSAPLKDPKIALGVLIEHNKQGVFNQTGFSINYAYRLPMATGKLSLGLRLGITTGSENNVEVRDPGDPLFSQTNIKYTLPGAGFGVYFTSRKYWAGFSVPRLMNPTPDASGGYKVDYESKRYEYYFSGGGVIPVNADISVEPSGLIVLGTFSRSIAINAMATYKKDYNAGLGFRSSDKAIVILLGYRLNNQFTLGYSYDLSFGNKLYQATSGSHEINLSYKFGYTVNASSPRRF